MRKLMNMAEKVSVIMATSGTPKSYLHESIDSILRQTYENIELIIVCDGSKENYDCISNCYNDPRIKLFLNKTNKGLPFSLNKAIRKSTGTYIARMDSDDISLPCRLERQIAYLKRGNLDICGASAIIFGNGHGKKNLLFNSVESMVIQSLFMAVMIHPTVFGKKDVFANNGYNEKYKCSQDFELWSRISDKCRMGNYPGCLLKYRVHGNQSSKKKSDEQRRLSRLIIKENACKITGEYDEKIFNCLWFLSGRKEITKINIMEFSQLVDYVLQKNRQFDKYNNRLMRRIFYNRFFELAIKNKIMDMHPAILKKMARIYNVIDLARYLSNKL